MSVERSAQRKPPPMPRSRTSSTVSRVGISELRIARDLERLLREEGADGLAFDPIVAFGENAAEPHHEPGTRMLEEGDVITLDFGGLVDGYHADMTRTVAFGSLNGELRKVHEIVREAQQSGHRRRPCGRHRGRGRRGVPHGDRRGRLRGVLRPSQLVTASDSRSTRARGWARRIRTSSRRARSSRWSPASTCRVSAGSGSRTWWR